MPGSVTGQPLGGALTITSEPLESTCEPAARVTGFTVYTHWALTLELLSIELQAVLSTVAREVSRALPVQGSRVGKGTWLGAGAVMRGVGQPLEMLPFSHSQVSNVPPSAARQMIANVNAIDGRQHRDVDTT